MIAKRLKWAQSAIEARLTELTELMQLETEMLDRYPLHLSGGQQQRVSLMRALMLDPDILLFDEPFAALDPLIRNELQSSLREIFEKLNKTVVLVTHDLNEAAFLADTIVLINNGEIIQSGSIKELVHAPKNAFVEKFIKAQRGHLPGAAQ